VNSLGSPSASGLGGLLEGIMVSVRRVMGVGILVAPVLHKRP